MFQTSDTVFARLPIKRPLEPIQALTLLLAVLLSVASLAGLLFRDALYPTPDLLQALLANDAANLVIGLPALLGSVWLARKGSLVGLLFWPGALLYGFYSYLAYVFATPLGWATVFYLLLVALSAYTFVALLLRVDAAAVQQQLAGRVPERFSGGVMVGLGLLFLLRIIGLWASGAPLTVSEQAVQFADLLTMPIWVVGGALLWRRRPTGYTLGLGLLFQGSALFIALILVLLLRPVFGAAAIGTVITDVAVIAALSLVCLIPFGLFLRRVSAASSPVR